MFTGATPPKGRLMADSIDDEVKELQSSDNIDLAIREKIQDIVKRFEKHYTDRRFNLSSAEKAVLKILAGYKVIEEMTGESMRDEVEEDLRDSGLLTISELRDFVAREFTGEGLTEGRRWYQFDDFFGEPVQRQTLQNQVGRLLHDYATIIVDGYSDGN